MARWWTVLALVGLSLSLAGCDACFNWRFGQDAGELLACKGPAPNPGKQP